MLARQNASGPKEPHPALCATFPRGEGTLINHRGLSLLLWRSCRNATDEVPLAVVKHSRMGVDGVTGFTFQ